MTLRELDSAGTVITSKPANAIGRLKLFYPTPSWRGKSDLNESGLSVSYGRNFGGGRFV